MKKWTGKAPSVQEAVQKGLRKLNLTENEVNIQVTDELTSSLFSLFGYRRMCVKITEKKGAAGKEEEQKEQKTIQRKENRRREDRNRPSKNQTNAQNQKRRSQRTDRDHQKKFSFNDQKSIFSHKARNNEKKPSAPMPREERAPAKPNPVTPQQSLNTGRMASPGDQHARANEQPTPPSRAIKKEPIQPDVLLEKWKVLLGLDDLTWETNSQDNHNPLIRLKTAHPDKIAGKGGQDLSSFEYLFNIVSSNRDKSRPWIRFDWQKTEPSDQKEELVDMAHYAANEVRRTGRVYRLDPMESNERKLIHHTLANEADVETVSEGEGPYRKVVVRLKSK